MLRKNYKFIKDFKNKDGQVIPRGTIIEIIDDKIFMYNGVYGGELLGEAINKSLQKFIEDESKIPNYLKEEPLRYNKV